MTDTAARRPGPDSGRVARLGDRRWALIALTALVLARAAWYAIQGVGFVLDDWSLAGYRHFNGAMTDVMLESRPGTWLTLTTLYAIADTQPLVLFALITALYLLATVLLYLLLARYVSPLVAVAVAATWVVLPNHNTIALWGASGNGLVALVLALAGVLVLTHGRWLAGGLLLAASVLCYELFTPLCLLAPVLVPGRWQLQAPRRQVAVWQRAVAVALSLAAAGWSSTHSSYPLELRMLDPVVFWSGHFGTGLLASAAPPTLLRTGLAAAAAVGVIVCAVAWVKGERDRETGPTLVVVGVALMAIGGWVGFTLPLGSHGQNDRLYAASSIGSALVVVGIVRYAWVRSHAALPSHGLARFAIRAAVVTFVFVCLAGQRISLGSWIRAGDDAVAALHHIDANAAGDPGASHFVIGPTRIYRNAVSGIQDEDGKWALRLTFGGEGGGTLRIPDTAEAFVQRSPDEVLVEWRQILPSPPPSTPAEP